MMIQELIQSLKRFALESFKFVVTNNNGSAGAEILTGTGSPENVVAAPKGSVFLRQDGSTSTSLYVKTDAGGAAVAATGTLTGTEIAAEDTVTIAGVVYTFVADLSDPTVPYEVLVGATDSDSLDNLIAAINAAAGAGTTYGIGTLVHPTVSAAAGAGDTITATAKTAGPGGNLLGTTAALTAGDWAAATLTGGRDAGTTGWTAK